MNIAKPAASYFTLSDSRRYMLALLLSSVLLFLSSANATPIETQADIGCTYDDNVSRTMPANQLHDFSCGLNLKRPAIIPLAEHARVLANGYLGAELFNRYSGLSRVYGAAQAELQYRSSSEFGTPLYALFALDDAGGLMAGQADAKGVVLFRQDLVVVDQIAAADGGILHAHKDLALLGAGRFDVQDLELPGTDNSGGLH